MEVFLAVFVLPEGHNASDEHGHSGLIGFDGHVTAHLHPFLVDDGCFVECVALDGRLEWLSVPFNLVGVALGLVQATGVLHIDVDLRVSGFSISGFNGQFKRVKKVSVGLQMEGKLKVLRFQSDLPLQCHHLQPLERPCWGIYVGRNFVCSFRYLQI